MHRSHNQGLERNGNELFLYYTVLKEWINTQEYCNNRERRHIFFWGTMGIGVWGGGNAILAYEREIHKEKRIKEHLAMV